MNTYSIMFCGKRYITNADTIPEAEQKFIAERFESDEKIINEKILTQRIVLTDEERNDDKITFF